MISSDTCWSVALNFHCTNVTTHFLEVLQSTFTVRTDWSSSSRIDFYRTNVNIVTLSGIESEDWPSAVRRVQSGLRTVLFSLHERRIALSWKWDRMKTRILATKIVSFEKISCKLSRPVMKKSSSKFSDSRPLFQEKLLKMSDLNLEAVEWIEVRGWRGNEGNEFERICQGIIARIFSMHF